MLAGQDGDVGKHTLPPHTTTEKITTRLQNKYHQKHQKIELYGSLTTKDLNKPHSSRWVGGAEMGRVAKMCGDVWRCMETYGYVE